MSDVKKIVAGTGEYGFEDTVAREKVNELVDTVNTARADISDLKSQISDIEEQIEGGTGSGLTSAIKSALMQFARNVAFKNTNGQTYVDDLYDALYPPVEYTAITLNTNSLSFGSLNSTQQLTATTTPTGGAVTWTSSNPSVATVSQTGLVTAIAYGNVTITASCGSLTATCAVTIAQATVTSISAVYAQGSKIVYNTDSLDSLKDDLTVTATWSNQTTSTVASADYTLSGTLAEGTNSITVTYGGKTATFNVIVTTNTIVYQLLNTKFTGDSNERIDTEVYPLTSDSDFTVTLSFTRDGNATNNSYIFQCMEGSSPWWGFKIQVAQTIWQALYGTTKATLGASLSTAGEFRLVIRHAQGTDNTVWNVYDLNNPAQKPTYTVTAEFKPINAMLRIGGNGLYGTVNSFRWLNYRFTDAEVDAFLEGAS